MSDEASHLRNLPLRYRFILKFPKLSLEGYSEKFQGLFWVVCVPLFLLGDFCMNLLILVCLPFPVNYLGFFVATSLIVMLILRVLVEQILGTSNAMLKESRRWDVDKAIQSYLQLLHKEEDDGNIVKEIPKKKFYND